MFSFVCGSNKWPGEKYSGPVDAPGMTAWLRKRLAPSSLALDGSTPVQDILTRDGILVVSCRYRYPARY